MQKKKIKKIMYQWEGFDEVMISTILHGTSNIFLSNLKQATKNQYIIIMTN